MTTLPNKNIRDDIAQQIYAACAEREQFTQQRTYLGMSGLYACDRRCWLNYHGLTRTKFDGIVYRKFQVGHERETAIVKDLRQARYRVFDQQEELSDFGGQLQGHIDGKITAPGLGKRVFLLEIKTCSDSAFKQFQKQGIEYKPEYLNQVTLYLGYSGLVRCLFCVENKSSQALYIEKVYFDEKKFVQLKQKAHDIIYGKTCPDKPEKTNYMECKFCPHKNSLCLEPPMTNKFDAKGCIGCGNYVDKAVLPCAVDILIREIKGSVLCAEADLPFKQDVINIVRSIEDLHPEFVVDNRLLNVKGGEDLLKLLDFVLKKYASWVDLPTGDPNSPIEIQGLTYNSLKHIMYRLKPAEHEYCKLHGNKMIKRPVGCADRKC